MVDKKRSKVFSSLQGAQFLNVLDNIFIYKIYGGHIEIYKPERVRLRPTSVRRSLAFVPVFWWKTFHATGVPAILLCSGSSVKASRIFFTKWFTSYARFTISSCSLSTVSPAFCRHIHQFIWRSLQITRRYPSCALYVSISIHFLWFGRRFACVFVMGLLSTTKADQMLFLFHSLILSATTLYVLN